MRAGVRKLLLFGALAGVVGFLALDRPPERGNVAPGAPAVGAERAKSADSLQLPERGGLARVRGELFGAPPLPPLAKAGPAPVAAAPVAPPVPYRFAGKVFNGAEAEVLISKGDLVFPVKVGDLLDGLYRVESIGADGIELLYVPLGTKDRITGSSVLDASNVTVAAAPAPAAEPAAMQKGDGKPAQLRWEGPERVQAGASFSVALRVSSRDELRAAPMQLRFEPDVLEAVDVRPGKFFGQGSNFSYRVSPEGSIFVGASSRPAAPGADAELVIVTFRPLRRGTAELSMSALSLQGAAGRAISHERVTSFRTAIQ
jgi:hypothetical protein